MNILSIGNSFSQDAQRYLHDIAHAAGEKMECINLYIGGCSLERHFNNMRENVRAYGLECNGHITGFPMSIEEALENRAWDIVTLQQVSHQSFLPETYHPYIDELAAYVREKAPSAKLYIHQTWGYEDGSERLLQMGFRSFKEMFEAVKATYSDAAAAVRADGIIPSGEVMAELLAAGVPSVHRDTFHASWGLARYALGLLWFRVLSGKSVKENRFCGFDEEVSASDMAIAQACVERVAQKYGY